MAVTGPLYLNPSNPLDDRTFGAQNLVLGPRRRVIVGIDPGLTGAIAAYDTYEHRVVAMISMPSLTLAKGKGKKHEISPQALLEMIENEITGIFPKIDQAFLERVSSSPQMGVTSSFQFGRGYGMLEGIIAALRWPVEYVTPQKWKRVLQVPADKDDARARASQLMPRDVGLWTPQRNVVNAAQCSGRAEAALICLYGARTFA